MDPTPTWQIWRNRLGRVKGVAIVYRASDYGLEIKSCLSNESNEEWCKNLCDILNEAARKGIRP